MSKRRKFFKQDLLSRGKEDVLSSLQYEIEQEELENAAIAGDPASQFLLGQGLIENQELEVGHKWLHQAARNLNANALTELGRSYYLGRGVDKDYAKAFGLFMRAAEDDEPNAQFLISLCYKFGNGTKQDNLAEFVWKKRAAEQGLPVAQHFLGLDYMTDRLQEPNFLKGFGWLKKAAEQGYAEAQYAVAHCYAEGMGVGKNMGQAFIWAARAAIQGQSEAQVFIGDCYTNGMGVKGSEKKAFLWYKRAAELGNFDGQMCVSECYEQGIGTAKDTEATFFWLGTAAGRGHAPAQFNLGYSLLEHDASMAIEWLKKAAKQGFEKAKVFIDECVRPEYKPDLAALAIQDPEGERPPAVLVLSINRLDPEKSGYAFLSPKSPDKSMHDFEDNDYENSPMKKSGSNDFSHIRRYRRRLREEKKKPHHLSRCALRNSRMTTGTNDAPKL